MKPAPSAESWRDMSLHTRSSLNPRTYMCRTTSIRFRGVMRPRLVPGLPFFVAVLAWLLTLTAAVRALDHSPRWIGTSLSYGADGLVDLDGFPVRDYPHCAWGVWQDEEDQNTVTLHFTRRTAGPFANSTKELFLSRSTDYLHRLQFPSDAVWNPANGAYMDGSVSFTQYSGAPLNVALFRYFHFPSMVFTTESDGREPRLTASAKKLIILVHGWNPDSNMDSYTGEFATLDTRLRAQIAGTDWKLLKYHWEADADTGPVASWTTVPLVEAVINGTEAAEGGHRHGQHLGELLHETCPNLERVHFIAHSAGSWAARAAAKYLLAHNPNVLVQLTFLDPYIPGSALADSSLTSEQISNIPNFPGSERVLELENYYSIDLTGPGTQAEFMWSIYDVNLQVDYPAIFPGDWTYGDFFPFRSGHAGPIHFYADTVTSTVPGATVPSDLANAPYYSINSTELGWWRSLFFDEILIDQQPASITDAAQGQPVTFAVHATTRREQKGFSYPGSFISYSWEKYDPATATWGTAIGSNALPTYTLDPTIAAHAGQYRVIASSGRNATTSRVFTLDFDTGAGSPLVALQSPAPGAIVSGLVAVAATVAPTINQVEFFVDGVLKATDTTEPFTFTWNTLQAADGPHTLTAQARGGLLGTLYGISAPVNVTVDNDNTVTPSNDPYEPNNSSLTATPMSLGQSRTAYVDSPSDVDWFSVQVTSSGVLTFDLAVPAGNDYDIELFGPDSAYIRGSYRDTGLAENITHNATVPGTYWVRVYGYPVGNGSYHPTASYTLTAGLVSGPIAILDPPQNRTVPAGASASFSVSASGAPVLAYQWQRNGVDIPGATGPTYATPVLALADSGAQFRVRVSNAFDSVFSPAATLTVTAASTITWTGTAGDGDWFNSANWNPMTVPTSNHIVQLNSGSLAIPANASFAVLNLNGANISGTFTVSGTLNWTGGTMSGAGKTTIAAGGVLNINAGNSNAVSLARVLENHGTANWLSGTLYFGNGTFDNYGAFIANSAYGLPAYGNTNGGINAFNNAGTFTNVGVALTRFYTSSSGVAFNNTGTVAVQAGSLSCVTYTQTSGTTHLNGGSLSSSNILDIQGGILSGNGTVSASVSNSGQVSPGTSPGTLTINGNYTQTASGILNIEIGGLGAGSQFDRLNVTGTATLNGTLRVPRINGFQPGAGNSFQVMTFAARSGNFSYLTGAAIDEDLAFTGAATSTSYTLTATASAYQQWKTAQFGANAGNPLIAGANADPEGDGITNWLEYAFGLHPLQADVSKLPMATLETTGGNRYLTMKYRRRTGQTTLDYNVGVSGDLQAWDWTESQIEQLGPPVATGDGLTEEVTVRLATPIDALAQRFLSLRVN